MFLVVIMVGAVFSALMSSRRAIVSSSEKEEALYSINSAYYMLKDCRSNPACHMVKFESDCPTKFEPGKYGLKDCNELFTFNFGNLCKEGSFDYTLADTPLQLPVCTIDSGGDLVCSSDYTYNFYTFGININCNDGI